MLRLLTAGESHGEALIAVLDGMPAGLAFSQSDIDRDLQRRQVGYGRGGRMQIERDHARVLSGARFGKTLGSPLALLIENRDWPSWQEKMAPLEAPVADFDRLLTPRPGHADLAGYYKYNFTDLRDVLERASARETATRVAAGALARRLLAEFDITVFSHVTSIGRVTIEKNAAITWEDMRTHAETSELRCADPAAEKKMKAAIDAAKENGDSLGGVFQVIALGAPPGLGSHVQWDRRLDGRLAGALMSIPAIKGVDIGLGFAAAVMTGAQVHDEIVPDADGRYRRPTNHAGGIEGGISNGEPIVLAAAMKPIPTLTKPLRSVNIATGAPAPAAKERSDVCAVPAAGVVGEAMCCLVLAEALMEKFGADTVAEMKSAWQTYSQRISQSRNGK
jgi:chorismate synthase